MRPRSCSPRIFSWPLCVSRDLEKAARWPSRLRWFLSCEGGRFKVAALSSLKVASSPPASSGFAPRGRLAAGMGAACSGCGQRCGRAPCGGGQEADLADILAPQPRHRDVYGLDPTDLAAAGSWGADEVGANKFYVPQSREAGGHLSDIDRSAFIPKPGVKYLLEPVSREAGGYLFIANTSDGNVECWPEGDPGEQGYITFSEVGSEYPGFYKMRCSKWRSWYIYMQDNSKGNVRAWDGDPGPAGYWKFEAGPPWTTPWGPCRLISTAKWPGSYLYCAKSGLFDTTGNCEGWQGDPGAQGWWAIMPKW